MKLWQSQVNGCVAVLRSDGQGVSSQLIRLRFEMSDSPIVSSLRCKSPIGRQVKIDLELGCVKSHKSDTWSNRLEVNARVRFR